MYLCPNHPPFYLPQSLSPKSSTATWHVDQHRNDQEIEADLIGDRGIGKRSHLLNPLDIIAKELLDLTELFNNKFKQLIQKVCPIVRTLNIFLLICLCNQSWQKDGEKVNCSGIKNHSVEVFQNGGHTLMHFQPSLLT